MKNPFSYVTPFEPKLVISEIQISILKGLLSLPLMNESRNLINKMKRIPRPFFFFTLPGDLLFIFKTVLNPQFGLET